MTFALAKHAKEREESRKTRLNNTHKKQLLTYLQLTGRRLGYLLNFMSREGRKCFVGPPQVEHKTY
jgi:hypothetical protein